MSRSRRLARPTLLLAAVAVLALVLSACAHLKPNSLQLSQPAGIGPVKVHFELCTDIGPDEDCGPNEDEGQSQYMLALAIPKGSVAPQAITAIPKAGGAPIRFTRNEEVTKALQNVAQEFSSEGGYPPEGTDSAGYLSAVFDEEKGQTREWLVDLELSLPAAADGGSYGGPFATSVIFGWRKVDGTHPASRPVDCYEPVGEPPTEYTAACGESAFAELGTSDLKIAPPAPAAAYVGGKATLGFPFDFASTATPSPGFVLSATSTLPQATLKLPSPTFVPGAPDPSTHRSPASSPAVVVTVPKTAKPGVYEVTLTAKAGAGGSVSQTAKLKVTKPKLKLGGVKLNKAKGTATVTVKVPSAGTLSVGGKGVVKAKKKVKAAKTLKVVVKAAGTAKSLLAEEGKARVRAKINFKPSSGIAVTKTKTATLKKS